MEGTQYYLTMAITGVGTFVLAALAFILAFNNRITEAYNMGKTAKEQADANKDIIRDNHEEYKREVGLYAAKLELISRDYHTMEVELSTKISSLAAMTEGTAKAVVSSETRIAKSIEDLERTVHGLSTSMMKTLGELAGRKT